MWWAFRSTRHPHCPPSHDPCACARSCVGSSRAGFCRRAISLSELLQLFALQTSVSVVAFARALSSSSGAYQLRATVRRPYRRTREGRRGESLTCRNLPRRVPVTRVRHGASARAQLGTLVAVACCSCSSFRTPSPPTLWGLPRWAFRSPRPPPCRPPYDACACARSYVGRFGRDFSPRD